MRPSEKPRMRLTISEQVINRRSFPGGTRVWYVGVEVRHYAVGRSTRSVCMRADDHVKLQQVWKCLLWESYMDLWKAGVISIAPKARMISIEPCDVIEMPPFGWRRQLGVH